jgi:hypothetical protein
MGIKENLQTFLDPEFDGYVGFPGTIDNPSSPESEWTNAIQPEITTFLAPSAAAFFVDGGSALFLLTAADLVTSIISIPLADALDRLMGDVADGMTDAADTGGGAPITPPSTAFDSYNTIFDPDLTFTTEEICQRAEDRILEWLSTGIFTAFYVSPGTPPTGFAGIPTPWGVSPPIPEDLDKDEDGVNIPDDSDDEDAGVS